MNIPELCDDALEDLAEIWEYIAVDSPETADRFLEVLYTQCQLIADYPKLGRARDQTRKGLRGMPVGQYVLLYEIRDGKAFFLRIIHGARDIQQLF